VPERTRRIVHHGGARLLYVLTLAAGLLLAAAEHALAGDTQLDFVPEVNAYLKLNDTLRLFLLAGCGKNV
jgi:hypothetical protein